MFTNCEELKGRLTEKITHVIQTGHSGRQNVKVFSHYEMTVDGKLLSGTGEMKFVEDCYNKNKNFTLKEREVIDKKY